MGGAPSGGDSAEYDYNLGGEFRGRVEGECEALGVAYPPKEPGQQSVHADAATLLVHEIWVNYTVLLPDTDYPIHKEGNASRTVRPHAVPPGQIEVKWPSAGAAAIQTDSEADDRPFEVRMNGANLVVDPANTGHRIEYIWDAQEDGSMIRRVVSLHGWGRLVRPVDTETHLRGDVAVYLRRATVTAPGFEFTVPPMERRVTRAPGVELVTEHNFYAVLRLRGAQAELPETAQPYCGGLALDVSGLLLAHQAKGYVMAQGQNASFDKRVLELGGEFRLTERPDGDGLPYFAGYAPVRAQAFGRITNATVDFESVPTTGPAWETGAGVALAGAAAGLAWAAWKLLGGLFTRLRRDDLLDQDARRRVYDAVVANPAATLARVAEAAALDAGTTRYHLRVLAQHGRLRAFKVQRLWHYAAADANADRARTEAWLRTDPRLEHLPSHLRPEGVPAKSLVSTLRRQFQVSRSGAWKLIRRAESARLLVKERSGREVILRIPG